MLLPNAYFLFIYSTKIVTQTSVPTLCRTLHCPRVWAGDHRPHLQGSQQGEKNKPAWMTSQRAWRMPRKCTKWCRGLPAQPGHWTSIHCNEWHLEEKPPEWRVWRGRGGLWTKFLKKERCQRQSSRILASVTEQWWYCLLGWGARKKQYLKPVRSHLCTSGSRACELFNRTHRSEV